ncbi:ArsI/CadI family heavy metal resistance metalloenzyme [Micromonospora sp. WMMD812]|uniref:ArsI/CadI family heavy metal resistance metalloenzyme n=1 Tax=Micromonospora sp. WMMD812 TaxID=3015152 RepID=UPI00248B389B|nr:ArsI/CadI family heavy metal resistance metalloenzyme [Micromonospora sp. WMMD812]WBB68620.1 ArsI/CadI family heavy metal resistance metalloenzyme [Micromonospora sp. WMMD812]
MSRVQLALRVSDLEGSVAFYTKLFGVDPAKRRPGYANFAIENPPLKLVLIEGEPAQPTVLDHLGVEVLSSADVDAATTRLTDAGLITLEESDTECCYALQDKVWVRGPGNEPWEVYTVKADSDTLAKSTEGACRCGDPTDAEAEKEPAAGGAAARCC